MLNSIIMLIILFFIFILIRTKFISPSPSDTPAGAIVMACGIFINGAMKNIYFLEKNASELFAMLLLLLWIFIWASFANSFIQNTFKEIHMKNPIKSFAIGTWVAGTSVCGIAVYQRLHALAFIAYFLFFTGAVIWLFYLFVFIRSYIIIFKSNLYDKVNGVLLISTVSTQSLVVLASTIFDKKYFIEASRFIISLGVILYIFAFILIFKRYFFTKRWNIEDDWQNTNCILHGAMSITGLASVSSGAVNSNLILVIWLWVMSWFVIVEAIEIIRAWKRIKLYGFVRGIAIYDVTQWSRIFTFGMLYTFTMRFNIASVTNNSTLINLRNLILQYGTWVMVCILVIEAILFFKIELTYRQKSC